MPRGVPKNGVRRTRAVIAAEEQAAVAGGAVDEPVLDEAPADEEAFADDGVIDAPEPVVSREQQQIKELRDQLARERGRKDVEPEADDSAPVDGEVIRVHFLEDGLTVNGKIMYRGDEMEFVVGSQAWKDTFDRFGRSTWLDLRRSEFDQVDRWGKIMFRGGPWPGKTYADGRWETLRAEKGDATVPPPSDEEIAAAEKARQRRSAPRLPVQV